MEIFMRNISYSATKYDVIYAIADILHKPAYEHHSPVLLNFHVRLSHDRMGAHKHNGQGILTVPTKAIGNQFLEEFEKVGLLLGNQKIRFSRSNHDAVPEVLERINRLPYVDPRALDKEEARERVLASSHASISKVQFGWECRDEAFSIEWEKTCPQESTIRLDPKKKELRVRIPGAPQGTHIIVIRFFQIRWCAASTPFHKEAAICFSLFEPPIFELEPACTSPDNVPNLLQRLSGLDKFHEQYAPYTSHAMRLVCSSPRDLLTFKRNSVLVDLHALIEDDVNAVRRELFTASVRRELDGWLKDLPWSVAFQIMSMVRSLVVDIREALSLKIKIQRFLDRKGEQYTSGLLRHFSTCAKELVFEGNRNIQRETVDQCFDRSVQSYDPSLTISLEFSDSIFECQHAIITPTTVRLQGPYPDRSNRVIRQYLKYHDRFLRVSFTEEARLRYHFDHEVDGTAFVERRVGGFLKSGIEIAGRTFQFLAYSNSGLREHAVWFVSPFNDPLFGYVDAHAIIESLGSFDNLPWDPKLMYCPARYGARISQAFTATDASIEVEVEQIKYIDDITRENSCFTDGVGTVSNLMADDIWKILQKSLRRSRRAHPTPRAFQIRFMGSKGMLSVDHTLPGRTVCLRKSMVKFEAPRSRNIEIAQAFDKPGIYYLNRPLIMILEGLGVPYEVFKNYQDKVVENARTAIKSLPESAKLLEVYGLGSSFRLPSVILGLHKLGFGLHDLPTKPFFHRLMGFVVYDILRELKHRARIPIPGGWTLVGVADVHKFLKEREIFACIRNLDDELIYLEGDVLISRSPTVHPGDVQVVRAIGKPPPGSCFDKEPLTNTVVFSVLGSRSLPSMLGGGDLDGDMYNLVPLDTMRVPQSRAHSPAEYPPVPKKVLGRPGTMGDVADFVVDYINSDVLGLVATRWLMIADQSQVGIFDPACMVLSELHSIAVDFQKNGQPVPTNKIPKLKHHRKPDWSAPETVELNSTPNYYQSQRAIGKLFRAIVLPTVPVQRHVSDDDRSGNEVYQATTTSDSRVYLAIRALVFQHISPMENEAKDIPHLFERYASNLYNICAMHTLSYSTTAILTEEEAVIGTIVANTSQPRRRTDLMSKLRESTDFLVRGVREQLVGDENSSEEQYLNRAWFAWNISIERGNYFGADSFHWIALGAIFEVVKAIKERKGTPFALWKS